MSSPPLDESPLPRALIEAWRADQPSPGELRRGYARYLEQRPARRGRLSALGGVAVGLLLGVSLAQAATLAPWHLLGLGQRVPSAPRQPPALGAPARAPTPGPELAPVASSKLAAAPIAPDAPGFAPASASRAVPAPLPSAPAGTRMQEQWQRAASALRAGDFTQAHRALVEIERSALGGERDAARLARAQLLASHGRDAEASRLLAELSQQAQSELVRRKASELLGGPSENGAPDRSAAPGGDTK